jgi:hypothetical protein
MSMFANKLLTEQKRKWTTADHIRTIVTNVIRRTRVHHLSHSSSIAIRSQSKISENCIAFKDQYSVHNSHPIVPFLRTINTVYITPFYAFKTDPNIVLHLPLVLSSGLFPTDFPTKSHNNHAPCMPT